MQEISEEHINEVGARYEGERDLHFSLEDPGGQVTRVFALLHKTTKQAGLLVGDALDPIIFDTPYGKTMWVNVWGLLKGAKYFIIDDGMPQSHGIYRLDGSRTSISFNSPYNTIEVVYRIRRHAFEMVEKNRFHLVPKLSTLAHMPTFGSQ